MQRLFSERDPRIEGLRRSEVSFERGIPGSRSQVEKLPNTNEVQHGTGFPTDRAERGAHKGGLQSEEGVEEANLI